MSKTPQIYFQPATSESDALDKREDTRSRLAHIFIFGFFSLVILLLIATTFFNLAPDVAKDYLLAIGSPLGFVIAFYFKSASSN